MKKIDLTSQRFGRWTVESEAEPYPNGNGTRWNCICDCGNKAVVASTSLRKGRSRSCGCLHEDELRQRKKHGHAGHIASGQLEGRSRLYNIWALMKQRCTNPNTERYSIYGGRGIKVCDEWQEFKPFMEWANKNGYKKSASIDRIDPDGNYEPGNCRWATSKEQANNTRANVNIAYMSETHTASEWSELTGIKLCTILKRYHSGWSIPDILSK